MKKILLLFLILILPVTLISCKEDKENDVPRGAYGFGAKIRREPYTNLRILMTMGLMAFIPLKSLVLLRMAKSDSLFVN